MSDLISRQALIEEVKKGLKGTHHDNNLVEQAHRIEHIHLLNVIAYQPTAFDVDKVVEQLVDEITSDVDPDTGEYCNNWVVDMQNEIIGRHIDIIRDGLVKNV